MRIRFWGTRGSIAKPGRSTLRYGGNTSCVEVRADDGTLVVLDCGTGAHELGRALAEEIATTGGPRDGHLLIGHTHWDHIQGFPFFEPLFVPGSEWHFYAPGRSRDLQDSFSGQMSYEYSPITLEYLNADAHYHGLSEGTFEIGSIRVRTQFMHHPALTLAYRLEADGASVVYATDHEPHSLHRIDAPPGTKPVHHEDRRHIRFLEGADLVIHDGQYTLDEFPAKAGWGHSPIERAVDYGVLADVQRLAFTHHDPERGDDEVSAMGERARAWAKAAHSSLDVFPAAEGDIFELSGSAEPATDKNERSALLTDQPRRASTVLVVDDDPDMVVLLATALRADGIRVLTASDGTSALEMARRELPTLILLDLNLPAPGGIEVCRILRDDPDPRLHDIPIVVLTGERLKETDVVDAFVAGATDYIAKPVKPTLVRSRVRGWLLRRGTP